MPPPPCAAAHAASSSGVDTARSPDRPDEDDDDGDGQGGPGGRAIHWAAKRTRKPAPPRSTSANESFTLVAPPGSAATSSSAEQPGASVTASG